MVLLKIRCSLIGFSQGNQLADLVLIILQGSTGHLRYFRLWIEIIIARRCNNLVFIIQNFIRTAKIHNRFQAQFFQLFKISRGQFMQSIRAIETMPLDRPALITAITAQITEIIRSV
ncbi:hypothetical protein SDC9_181334 [bioreactor metagenome]|uniref:Uncharacterized protein n=1 Tax=bioreactor metagenome TaxID=1076179 RepID=A0A645H673_9ZZZZ